jgi:hypothetical protein
MFANAGARNETIRAGWTSRSEKTARRVMFIGCSFFCYVPMFQ